MKAYRAIRYRLHPRSRFKNQQLQGTAGACRFIWNYFVGKIRDDYIYYGECDYRYFTIGKEFTQLRKTDYDWLQNYSAYIVKMSLKPIETTYKEYFKDLKAGNQLNRKPPKFHSKYIGNPSFPIDYQTSKLSGSSIYIQKIGWMKIEGNNPHKDGVFKSGTVKYECGNWYAYLVYEVELEEKDIDYSKCVGIDLNVGQIALSNKVIYGQIDIKNLEARKRRYQRMMSRRNHGCRKHKVNPSNRYLLAKLRHQKVCKKIKQIRNDWCHQVSKEIAGEFANEFANEFDSVYLEDLKISNMTKSAKGTLEDPGKNVKQKSGLNRSILASSWGKFDQCLSYKTSVLKVPAQYTSQMCFKCGHIEKGNRISQSNFKCLSCGHEDNADVNAALNIMAFGNRATGHGDCRVAWSEKCQRTADSCTSDCAY